MAEITSLSCAIHELLHDGDTIALEGFSHLVPFAAGHEIIRQGRQNLTLVRLSADLLYDQMIGAGCAQKLIFSWAGNPGVGLLHRFRDAVERQWPKPVEIEEHTHAGLAAALVAGASQLPFGILDGYFGTDLPQHTASVAPVICPFTAKPVMAVRAINPDLTIVHAQQADRNGNVLMWGVTGVQKEAVLAAKRVIISVEEICDELRPVPNGVILPSWVITAVAVAPGGARPSYAHGYYKRDNAFYKEWDLIARDRNQFQQWLDNNVLQRAAPQHG